MLGYHPSRFLDPQNSSINGYQWTVVIRRNVVFFGDLWWKVSQTFANHSNLGDYLPVAPATFFRPIRPIRSVDSKNPTADSTSGQAGARSNSWPGGMCTNIYLLYCRAYMHLMHEYFEYNQWLEGKQTGRRSRTENTWINKRTASWQSQGMSDTTQWRHVLISYK